MSVRTKSDTDYRPFYKEVGHRVQLARKAQNMTQAVLASRVALTRTSITNIEQGRQNFMLHTLMDIAVALRVPPLSLLPDYTTTTSDEEIDALLKAFSPKEAEWVKASLSTRKSGG